MFKIKVPFGNLKKQYFSIKTDIDKSIASIIDSSSFIRGDDVKEFERRFAKKNNSENCISCGNGTDALYISMKSLGIKNNDEVIVPAMSWISTSETVTQSGGKVVFCDIDPKTYTLDANKIKSKITSRTVGIIPVHLYGHPSEMDEIQELALKHGLWIIEDCAQAHFAKYNNKFVGSFGVAATFSFYPGKNLGAMGDAGAIITNDKNLAIKMAKFSRHGGLNKHEHEIEGINSRMDTIQAAVLNVKLNHIFDWTNKRQELASKYNYGLAGIENIILPTQKNNVNHVWHLYVIQTNNRKDLATYLSKKGIQTIVNYPTALPFLQCYESYSHRFEDFPVSYMLQENALSLPLYPEMSNEQQEYVIDSIKEYFKI